MGGWNREIDGFNGRPVSGEGGGNLCGTAGWTEQNFISMHGKFLL